MLCREGDEVIESVLATLEYLIRTPDSRDHQRRDSGLSECAVCLQGVSPNRIAIFLCYRHVSLVSVHAEKGRLPEEARFLPYQTFQ